MEIRFSDGASYERMMGVWSQSVGRVFLDWLQPEVELSWLDVGCGSGAFSSIIFEKCAPFSLLGLDPSEDQLVFAQGRGLGARARFLRGDAMAIDLPDRSIDIATSALVLHFLPDPETGLSEMARVVRTRGMVAGYTWDIEGGGFPYEAIHRGLLDCDLEAPNPPHPEAGNRDELDRLWKQVGLTDVEVREISVTQDFQDFDAFWETAALAPRIDAVLRKISPGQTLRLKNAARQYVPDPLVITARANAARGRV